MHSNDPQYIVRRIDMTLLTVHPFTGEKIPPTRYPVSSLPYGQVCMGGHIKPSMSPKQRKVLDEMSKGERLTFKIETHGGGSMKLDITRV